MRWRWAPPSAPCQRRPPVTVRTVRQGYSACRELLSSGRAVQQCKIERDQPFHGRHHARVRIVHSKQPANQPTAPRPRLMPWGLLSTLPDYATGLICGTQTLLYEHCPRNRTLTPQPPPPPYTRSRRCCQCKARSVSRGLRHAPPNSAYPRTSLSFLIVRTRRCRMRMETCAHARVRTASGAHRLWCAPS